MLGFGDVKAFLRSASPYETLNPRRLALADFDGHGAVMVDDSDFLGEGDRPKGHQSGNQQRHSEGTASILSYSAALAALGYRAKHRGTHGCRHDDQVGAVRTSRTIQMFGDMQDVGVSRQRIDAWNQLPGCLIGIRRGLLGEPDSRGMGARSALQ